MAKKSKNNTVKEVLRQVPEKELRKFVEKELGIQEVLDDFMSEFKKYFLKGDTGEAYISQLTSAFIDAEGDYGYIDFHNQSKLLRVVTEVAEAAGEFREKGYYEAAIDICFTILEGGIEAINHSDDSMGYLGSIMEKGMQGLYALADPDVCQLDEDSRWSFMDRCWTCIEEDTFEGWDWHAQMYEFLITLANDEEEYENIMERLDDDEYFGKDYNKRKQLQMKRELILKWKGEDVAHELMMSNLQIQEFREKAIEEAMEEGDLKRACQLALDGIEQDKKDKPGIVPRWNHWMLRIAQKEKNYDLTVEYATKLYLHPWHEEGDFYKLLKETVPSAEWNTFAEGLAKEAIASGHKEMYADLCAREQWYDRLMAYVRKNRSMSVLRQYESQLLKDYRAEIIDRYISYANYLMTSTYNRNRNTYQEMCRNLQYAIKLGGSQKVAEAVKGLREKYPRSRALIEELNGIKL